MQTRNVVSHIWNLKKLCRMYNIDYQSLGMWGGREVQGGHIMGTTTQMEKVLVSHSSVA